MRDKTRTHHPLASLAKRQHGVVSIRQLQRLGYSRDSVARAAAAGSMHRLHRGVYAVGHTCLNWHGHCLAAVLACAPEAVASHRSAAWLWELERARPGTIDVTAPTRRHRRTALQLHYAALTGEDRAIRDGIPVTSLPRTLLDCAGALSRDRLDRLLERAEQRSLLDTTPIEALLARTRGHRGAARLRRALELYRPPPFTRSGLERRFLELVRRAGLPVPSTGYIVAGYELDVYWWQERFAVELDVYETHGSRHAFEQDRRRHEDLKLDGVEMIRVTGIRLAREPKTVMERVRLLLEQRRAEMAGAAMRDL